MPSENPISVVEDDESLRSALVGLIRSSGYTARGFASAEEYLAVQDGLCRCVITDIQMPGLSGIEMIARLRGMGYPVPVIMVTARTEPAIEAQAIAAGALCVLRKPFEAEALLDRLRGALGESAGSP